MLNVRYTNETMTLGIAWHKTIPGLDLLPSGSSASLHPEELLAMANLLCPLHQHLALLVAERKEGETSEGGPYRQESKTKISKVAFIFLIKCCDLPIRHITIQLWTLLQVQRPGSINRDILEVTMQFNSSPKAERGILQPCKKVYTVYPEPNM